jgi:serine/threonine-protein kinase RsbW
MAEQSATTHAGNFNPLTHAHDAPRVPGSGGGWWEQAFPGNVDQLTRMRAMLGRLLADCPVADDVILLMSELGANAVRHSGSGHAGGMFTVRVLDLPGQYVLGVVEDGGSGWDGNLRGSARDASGLCLVLALSADCGVHGGGRNRAVWFRVQYPFASGEPGAQPGVPGALPVRVPGTQGPPFPVPSWNPSVPGRAAADPTVMERVRVALVRL